MFGGPSSRAETGGIVALPCESALVTAAGPIRYGRPAEGTKPPPQCRDAPWGVSRGGNVLAPRVVPAAGTPAPKFRRHMPEVAGDAPRGVFHEKAQDCKAARRPVLILSSPT